MLDQSLGFANRSCTGSAMLDQFANEEGDNVDEDEDEDEDDLSCGGSAIDENLLGWSLEDDVLCFLAICRTTRDTIALSAAML